MMTCLTEVEVVVVNGLICCIVDIVCYIDGDAHGGQGRAGTRKAAKALSILTMMFG